ncbi:uncharacterized protein MELLADRAFT_71892 [Melampsora larici-populina 98AG31]|uniref:UspA domain-containing protein n=1 Tax=Melampsora larici-populina (strain 98AG31 / pathotype 3-4-7) TaxID=747676 RepID=F4RLX8_MELLP|nr:uncharacterized protein MELLADRAFT_71892 [Melampsora larici-populina 98AG31]EGG06622.1 hypothetical protein MELLADRAFT_71892 [Melampsora larici-populina 98AG31]
MSLTPEPRSSHSDQLTFNPSDEPSPLSATSNHGTLRSALKPSSYLPDPSQSRPSLPTSDVPSKELSKLNLLEPSPITPIIPRPKLNRAHSSTEDLPPGYQRRVGFSTLDTEEPTKGGGTGAEYSFTLQAKSSKYCPGRDSRCFLVATDGEEYSIQALDWLMGSLVENGDEVVVLRVIEPGSSAHRQFMAENEETTKSEAQDVLFHVLTKNDRQINVTVEFVIGPPIKTIQRMLEVYKPDSLVVGTRGRSTSAWQKAFSLGSTSQYLVARSPVPVIVVRPQRKVEKSKEARAKDPKRRSYQALFNPSSKPISERLPTNYESQQNSDAEQEQEEGEGTLELRREKTNPF